MAEILFIIKIVLCTASFILLCVAALKLNLNPADRAKQFLMPAIALIYGILALIFINDLYLLPHGVQNDSGKNRGRISRDGQHLSARQSLRHCLLLAIICC